LLNSEEFWLEHYAPQSYIRKGLVAYIASPLASATTGAAVRVDGGVIKSAF
jgi:enoyl-[acyl-carrier-protein] reductase (NADH)